MWKCENVKMENRQRSSTKNAALSTAAQFHGPYFDCSAAGWGYPEPYTRTMFSILGIAVTGNKNYSGASESIGHWLKIKQTGHIFFGT